MDAHVDKKHDIERHKSTQCNKVPGHIVPFTWGTVMLHKEQEETVDGGSHLTYVVLELSPWLSDCKLKCF